MHRTPPAVPRAIAEFLPVATPPAWIEWALDELHTLVLDHANCEYKAAASAMAMLHRYPGDAPLVERMSRLAREELRHFEQVRAMMRRLGIAWRGLAASGYAAGLRETVRGAEPARRLDTLVVGAFIEARSCERFALLAPRLPEPLAAFYGGLLASEARHFADYLKLAEAGAGAQELRRRTLTVAAREAELVQRPSAELRFHSGPPA